MVADTSFSVARQSTAGVQSMHDFEAAEKMTYAGLAQLESLHVLSPDNEDGLFLLLQAWDGAGQAFIMDEAEEALVRGDEASAAYHKRRARAAFQRAKAFGLELFALQAEGFPAATKNAKTLKGWLEAEMGDRKYAPELLWLGIAWLGLVGADSENSETVADLWVGVALIEHSIRLDETVEYGLGHVILGAYHARAAIAAPEFPEAKRQFDRALQINGGKYLVTKLQLAQRYFCQTHDKASYLRTLNEVLDDPDPLPAARLANTVAKRFAARYLADARFRAECGFGL